MLFYIALAALAALITYAGSRISFQLFRGPSINSSRRYTFFALTYAIAIILLCVIAASRDPDIGTDTSLYTEKSYDAALDSSFVNFSDIYSSWGFLVRSQIWIIANLTHSFFWELFFLQLVSIVPTFIGIRLLAGEEGAPLGVFCYALAFYPMSFNMMRQMIAMGFVLLAFALMARKRYVWSLLLVAIAMGYHSTGLLGLALYPLVWFGSYRGMTHGAKTALLILAGCAALAFAFAFLPLIAVKYNVFSDYFNYGTINALTGMGERSAVFIFSVFALLSGLYLCLKKAKMDASSFNVFCVTLFGVLLFPLCFISFYLYRISLYFILFMVVLIPLSAKNLGALDRRLLFIGTSVMLLVAYSYDYYVIQAAHDVVPYVLGAD